jgi:endo-1,4-beta-xylanase
MVITAWLGTATAEASTTRVREGAELRLPTGAEPLQRLLVVARARGCHRARAAVRIDGHTIRTLTFRSRSRHATVDFATPPLPGQVTLLARRCGLTVTRLKPVAVAPAASAATAVPLGTAITERPLKDPAYVSTLLSTYQSVTTENELKMDHTQPHQGDWEFESADRVVDFATKYKLPIRGHTLIFGTQTPKWVNRIPLEALVKQTLEEQVTEVMSRYKNRIHEWDVVNEALHHDGGYRHNAFYDKLGPAYVEYAFRAARAADPKAKLFYNEIGAEWDNEKRAAMLKLVGNLNRQHLIDGVGLQMHMDIRNYPTYDELVSTMRLFESYGLEVEITEMDVTTDGLFGGDRFERQAEVFAEAGRACRAVAACTRFTVWGVGDRVSWLSPARMPLLFDSDFRPKPALTALVDALR